LKIRKAGSRYRQIIRLEENATAHLTEIWVPYGPVEVSFDIKQENLSQVLDPQPPKLSDEDIERSCDGISEEEILILSGSVSTQKFLDVLLQRNKIIKKLIYPKGQASLARRKAQEFGIEAEPLNSDILADVGTAEGSTVKLPRQLPDLQNRVLFLTSVRYDPLFGLTSSASDMLSLVTEMKEKAFKLSLDELPCSLESSSASKYSEQVAQNLSGVKAFEIVEKAGSGILHVSYGVPQDAHSETIDYWSKNLSVQIPARSERVIFGCGGFENDRTLSAALARAFFPIVANVALPATESRICMLAECSHGLGSEAFLRFVTGRLEPRSKLGEVTYVEGIEVLLSLLKVQSEFQFTILTTLPKYYAEKFDFKTIGGARQTPSSLVQAGSRAKILVIPDASVTYFPT
jgi:hypothetical protein